MKTHIDEKIQWNGAIEIVIQNIKTGKFERHKSHNMIMIVGLNAIRDILYLDTPSDLKPRYMALGNSTTAVNNAQTILVAEQFRKSITTSTRGGNGATITTTYIGALEAVSFTIEELGWFIGTTATSSTNSGVMIARYLYHRAKSSSESLTVTRTDTFS